MESWKHAPHTHQNFRICTLLIVLASASAQTPQFEVASVKISVPPSSGRMAVFSSGGPGTKDPSRYRCENCALSGLMLDAFPLEEYQISEPEWMQSARFTISAKVPEGATKEQFRRMMQNLLIDRFQLKFHYEKKETQSYELVVLKNGPKMKESEGALGEADSRPPRQTERKMDPDGFPILPPGRAVMMMETAGGRATMRESDQSMAEFVKDLAEQVHHPVADLTGLKAKYDFTLNWLTERAGPDDTGPTIFAAVQKLGLKLESKKTQVEILVVDSIQKTPTEN